MWKEKKHATYTKKCSGIENLLVYYEWRSRILKCFFFNRNGEDD